MANSNMNQSASTFLIRSIACSTHTTFEFLNEIKCMLNNKSLQPRLLTFINAHVTNLACRDTCLREIIASARVVAADGMSIVWAGCLKGARIRKRCNMTETFRAFLESNNMPQSRALLIGGWENEAQRAAEFMTENSEHCNIICSASGYDTIEKYKNLIREQGPFDFILVGMGTPRSEMMLTDLAESAPESILWHIGGGTIGFYAGRIKEAPVWMRKSGLQWLHRLIVEPCRMWRRYILGNSEFVLCTIWDILLERFRKTQ